MVRQLNVHTTDVPVTLADETGAETAGMGTVAATGALPAAAIPLSPSEIGAVGARSAVRKSKLIDVNKLPVAFVLSTSIGRVARPWGSSAGVAAAVGIGAGNGATDGMEGRTELPQTRGRRRASWTWFSSFWWRVHHRGPGRVSSSCRRQPQKPARPSRPDRPWTRVSPRMS